ncbi:MAG: Cof-type HAD-IIB family hydrolase [Lachnospiraceae bacterium]
MTAIDLHVHSYFSDGTFTPSELVDYAIKKDLSAFALTDHDTVEGISFAIEYAKDKNIEVIPGIELSTDYNGKDIHILGLYIDYTDVNFLNQLNKFVNNRDIRNEKMCDLLCADGISISYHQLQERYQHSVITRAHFAKFLLEKGYVSSLKEAFDRYVGDNCKYFVPRFKITPKEAISLILSAKGIPILAHPLLYHLSKHKIDHLVSLLKKDGLMGIEAVYPTHSQGEEREIRKLAKKYNLCISGGSDFHGTTKPKLDLGVGYGTLFVPADLLDSINALRPYALFTDLDGTLLRSDGSISLETIKGLQNFVKQGNQLILSSGRTLDSIIGVIERFHLDIPNIFIIGNNGTLIYDYSSKNFLQEIKLANEDVLSLLSLAKKHGIYMITYNNSHVLCEAESADLFTYTNRVKLPHLVTDDISKHLDPSGTYKTLAINLVDKNTLECFRQEVSNFTKDKIACTFSNDALLEFLPIHAGKGNALKFLSQYLNIPLSHCIAIGDAENDKSMLQVAGISIAMKNGDPNLHNIVTHVSDYTNDEDGLLDMLHKLVPQYN